MCKEKFSGSNLSWHVVDGLWLALKRISGVQRLPLIPVILTGTGNRCNPSCKLIGEAVRIIVLSACFCWQVALGNAYSSWVNSEIFRWFMCECKKEHMQHMNTLPLIVHFMFPKITFTFVSLNTKMYSVLSNPWLDIIVNKISVVLLTYTLLGNIPWVA